MFKTLFVHSPGLLVDLINAVRDDRPAIETIHVLNPEIVPDAIEGKLIVLDVLARDGMGQCFNVEMQVRRQPALSRRSVFYLARVMAGQLQAGEDYTALEPVIGIHLLDFTVFGDRPDAGASNCATAITRRWRCRSRRSSRTSWSCPKLCDCARMQGVHRVPGLRFSSTHRIRTS